MNELQREWVVIHADIERYERFALLIKLFSVLICLLCLVFSINPWFSLVLISILWLQEGIWKTFQQRSTNRVLQIEKSLRGDPDGAVQAFELYSVWQAQRQGTIGLIKEYLTTSLKPTVAYPYIILLALSFALQWLT